MNEIDSVRFLAEILGLVVGQQEIGIDRRRKLCLVLETAILGEESEFDYYLECLERAMKQEMFMPSPTPFSIPSELDFAAVGLTQSLAVLEDDELVRLAICRMGLQEVRIRLVD